MGFKFAALILVFVIIDFSVVSSYSVCPFLKGCEFLIETKASYFEGFFNRTSIKCKYNSKRLLRYESLALSHPTACGFDSRSLVLKFENYHDLNSFVSNYFQMLNFSLAASAVVYLNGIRRVNIESPLEIPTNWKYILFVHFKDSSLKFVDNRGRVVETCADFNRLKLIWHLIAWNSSHSNSHFHFEFKNVRFKKAVCELAFKNAKIRLISLGTLFDSFFKTNLFRFTTEESELKNNNNRSVNSSITSFAFYSYGIDFDSRLLNKRVFFDLDRGSFLGHFRSIGVDTLRSFSKLASLNLFYSNFEILARRQGIEWIRRINADVQVDFTTSDRTSSSIDQHKNRILIILLDEKNDVVLDTQLETFPDTDFCIYAQYPFRQLVFVDVIFKFYFKNFTCTFFWLFQYHNMVQKYRSFLVIYVTPDFYKQNSSSRCNFTQLAARCNKSNYELRKKHFFSLEFLSFSDSLLIITMPLVCLSAIVFNSIVIAVLLNKQFKKEFSQNQYVYMKFFSVLNCLVALCQIFSLVSECQLPYGIFCSSIRKYVPIQYELVFAEFFLYFFIAMSNFSYLAFSICRLSLVGSINKNKLVKFVSKSGCKTLSAAFGLISIGLAVIKPLKYTVLPSNHSDAYDHDIVDFPNLFYKNKAIGSGFTLTTFKLKIIFDTLYDLVNYCVFVLVNMAIDVVLLTQVRRVMEQKEEKMSTQIRSRLEKLRKENRESLRRLVKLVMLSSLCGIALKVPNCLTSLNDFRLLISNLNFEFFEKISFEPNHFAFPYTMSYLCMLTKACLVFRSFGHFLYIVSLSANFFFLKSFDQNFKAAFSATFLKFKKPKKDC